MGEAQAWKKGRWCGRTWEFICGRGSQGSGRGFRGSGRGSQGSGRGFRGSGRDHREVGGVSGEWEGFTGKWEGFTGKWEGLQGEWEGFTGKWEGFQGEFAGEMEEFAGEFAGEMGGVHRGNERGVGKWRSGRSFTKEVGHTMSLVILFLASSSSRSSCGRFLSGLARKKAATKLLTIWFLLIRWTLLRHCSIACRIPEVEPTGYGHHHALTLGQTGEVAIHWE